MYFKNLLNSSSLLSMANFDAEADERSALRANLVKNNTVVEKAAIDVKDNSIEVENDEEENEDDLNDEKNEEKNKLNLNEEELSEEEKITKDVEIKAAEKQAVKAQRKQDRMQRRIDEAVAAAKSAKDELAAFKTANPNTTLTEEEIEVRAEIKAAEKLAKQKIEDLKIEFNNTCEKLQKEATKIDKDFYEKIVDISDQFGPIPSFMIGVLDDFENGAEVLAHIANDDELAEKIWDLKTKPAKMTKELVIISNQLADKNKAPKKQISKVKEPITAITGSRSTSTVITQADMRPENMDNYVAKRRQQMEANRKAKGF